jgi:hypothetical protein
MDTAHAPSAWLNASAICKGHIGTAPEHSFRRAVSAGSLISPNGKDGPTALLVETGVIAIFTAFGRTPPTCVGLAGPGVLLKPNDSPDLCYRAVGPVTLLSISANLVEDEIRRQPTLQGLYLAQLRERLLQAEILATCNVRHSLSQRCSRWLVTLHAHFGESIPVTHAFLASLLGVRRAGVSVTLEMFQHQSLVRQHRGRINVINPSRLEEYACDCERGRFLTKHSIMPQLLQRDPPIRWAQSRTPTDDVATLLAQSNSAIEVSRRLISETWRLRSSALRVLTGNSSLS